MIVKIGPTGIKGILMMKDLAKNRDKVIDKACAEKINADYGINKNAKALHPDFIKLKVAAVTEVCGGQGKVYTLENADAKDGKPLALPYFRAGQYISLKLSDGKSTFTRPYSICSSPEDALNGFYEIMVAKVKNGFASDYILENLKPGIDVTASSPDGNFYYEELRDVKNVVAVAGGSGITPFLSMAKAISDGRENFKLTILYGSRNPESTFFAEELKKLESDKIKIINVYSDTQGFITADVIKNAADASGFADYSLFICGPSLMYDFLEQQLPLLNLPKRRVRFELKGVKAPQKVKDETFKLTIHQWDKVFEINCKSNETLLVALERAGIKAPSKCRSGECGWCRSKLLSGKIEVPQENEGRRYIDVEKDYIHPCCTFPLSDIEIDVPGEKF